MGKHFRGLKKMVSLELRISGEIAVKNMKTKNYQMIPLPGKENVVCHAITLQLQN